MNARIEDLRPTIIPKSDQMNADDLISGPRTITVTDVRIGSSDDQPIAIHYEDDNGHVYKPCKTMRKVLIFAWGHDGRDWVGRSMTLYHDPQVKWAGSEVGGIRISHLSDIEGTINVSLAKTKGSKALHSIQRLATVDTSEIDNAPTIEALKEIFGAAYKANKAPHLRARLKTAYDKRLAELRPATKTLTQFVEEIDSAPDKATAEAILQEALTVLTGTQVDEIQMAFNVAWSE